MIKEQGNDSISMPLSLRNREGWKLNWVLAPYLIEPRYAHYNYGGSVETYRLFVLEQIFFPI